MKKQKILIISPHQLGELLDSYYWAKYASLLGYDVTYLGYKYKSGKIKPIVDKSFKQITVQRDKNFILFAIQFYFVAIKTIICGNFHNVIVVDFPYCFILAKMFPRRNIVYDIRTEGVSSKEQERLRTNSRLLKYASCFKKVSVISAEVAKDLKLSTYNVLPLGAICMSRHPKMFDTLRLLYIGTLNNRDLDSFLKGVALFKNKYKIPFTLDIIGTGTKETENLLKRIVVENNMSNQVFFHGFLNHTDAREFFDKCNLGISYVPIKSYYQNQPPTKTFEYLLSGMPCLATRTKANAQIINELNGYLIGASENDVCEGLCVIQNIFYRFNSESIKNSVIDSSWDEIVAKKFIPLFT